MNIKMIKTAISLFKSIKERLSARQFEILVAVIVGMSAGLLAVILKTTVHLIQETLKQQYLDYRITLVLDSRETIS